MVRRGCAPRVRAVMACGRRGAGRPSVSLGHRGVTAGPPGRRPSPRSRRGATGARAPPGREGRDVVVVRGEIDVATSPALREELYATSIDGGVTELVVDLSGLGFIDSSGPRRPRRRAQAHPGAGRRARPSGLQQPGPCGSSRSPASRSSSPFEPKLVRGRTPPAAAARPRYRGERRNGVPQRLQRHLRRNPDGRAGASRSPCGR